MSLLEGSPLVLRVADLCQILRVCETTLYKRIRLGQVPAFRRIGTGARARYEWLRPDVEVWLKHAAYTLRKVG